MSGTRTLSWHHAGVVVSSLDSSIEFYGSTFGALVELVIRDSRGTELDELHDLEDAEYDIAYLRFGEARLELIQFHDDPPAVQPPRKADQVGTSHIAFEVANVQALFDELTAQGVVFTRSPLVMTEGPAAGYVFAFLFDPDGNRIELMQVP